MNKKITVKELRLLSCPECRKSLIDNLKMLNFFKTIEFNEKKKVLFLETINESASIEETNQILDAMTFISRCDKHQQMEEKEITTEFLFDGVDCPNCASKIEKNFYNAVATNLTEIAIGGAVSEIGDHAFDGVNASQIIFAHKGRGIYYNHRQTSAVRSLVIGKNAFAGNHIITKLVLPATLKSLDDGAFRSCSSLVSVVFESGYSPSISSLGDFVFRDDLSMTDNEVVKFLIEDSKLSQRFDKVGSGIFMNTNITNVKTSDGLTTNKIVWIDKLLHVYYPSGFATDLTFNEKEIAGYAFVNAGSNTDTNQKITILFSNPDVIIHPYAFSNLHTNVKNIYLKNGTQSSVKIENVDVNAFDDTVKHTVTVHTNNRSKWIAKFQKVSNLNYFKFN